MPTSSLPLFAESATPMYESFFDCRRRPFAATPQVDLYYPGRTIESARQTIERCLLRAEGAALLLGPAGTGKSLLCLKTAERLRAETAVVQLSSGQLGTRRALMQGVLHELGLPFRGLDEGELRLALVDRLTGKADDRGMLLIVDDAHVLPLRLLDEIRLLADLNRRGEPRVRLLLCGAASLEERLASPRLEALQQRITARCYLEAFDRNDTINYVRHQLTQVGGDPTRIFTEEALETVYRATEGIPRLVNQTCDHAMMLAFGGGVKPIAAAGIEEAWSDLQQLPTPWSQAKGYADTTTGEMPLEFGRFDDEPTAAPQPRVVLLEAKPTSRAVVERTSVESASVELVAAAPSSIAADSVEYEARAALNVIETQLAEWETEYMPVAKAEPEVEVMLGDSQQDPFAEDFVDEEVVVDRYVRTERLGGTARVQAYGSNERMIAALLGARTERRDPPALRCVGDALGGESDGGEPLESVIPEPELRASSPKVEKPQPHAAFVREVITAAVDPVEPEEVRITPRRTSVGDADMIILEPDPTYAPPPRPEAPLVRKQDYRQLFVRLRSGT